MTSRATWLAFLRHTGLFSSITLTISSGERLGAKPMNHEAVGAWDAGFSVPVFPATRMPPR